MTLHNPIALYGTPLEDGLPSREEKRARLAVATAAREEAIDRVERNTDPAWAGYADEVCGIVIDRGVVFTMDDVEDMLDVLEIPPPTPSSTGPVTARFLKRGLAHRIYPDVKSRRPQHHWDIRQYLPGPDPNPPPKSVKYS